MAFSPRQFTNFLDNLMANASRALTPSKPHRDQETLAIEEIKERVGDYKESILTLPHSSHISLKSKCSYKDDKQNDITTPLELPFVPSNPAVYKPCPYTFKIPSSSIPSTNGSNLAKCPPFYIQLDHALAVIWSLFSNYEAKKPLGAAQIQWALSFLRGIQSENGQSPKDVSVCIDAMEEALIQKYAEMANAVQQSVVKPEPIKKPSKIVEKNSTVSAASSSKVAAVKKSTTKKKDCSKMIQKVPFSVNYADMLKRKPAPEPAEAKSIAPSITESRNSNEQNSVSTVESITVSSLNLGANFSRDTIINFLKAWRKEQINKIQEELKRLHLIEEFISNCDQDNFTPYLDTTQLDSLVAQKVRNLKFNDSGPSISAISAKLPKMKPKKSS